MKRYEERIDRVETRITARLRDQVRVVKLDPLVTRETKP